MYMTWVCNTHFPRLLVNEYDWCVTKLLAQQTNLTNEYVTHISRVYWLMSVIGVLQNYEHSKLTWLAHAPEFTK
jgi:hypothetical protein